jgi:hypothetical protein
MKSIKQILSEANYMIELSEQSSSNINDELAARLAAAEARIAELTAEEEDSWIDDERAKQINALIQQTLQDADAKSKTIGPPNHKTTPTFEIDMNNGLGKLPDMNLGFDLDLNIPEDEPVNDIGWGFGESDPYYFDSDTPWGG